MRTVLLPPGGYPTAVNKYIIYRFSPPFFSVVYLQTSSVVSQRYRISTQLYTVTRTEHIYILQHLTTLKQRTPHFFCVRDSYMKHSYAPPAYLITVSIFNFFTGSASFFQLLSVPLPAVLAITARQKIKGWERDGDSWIPETNETWWRKKARQQKKRVWTAGLGLMTLFS
jgi:hypothetical protein